MKLEFYNCPTPESISSVSLPEKPEFILYRPDFGKIGELAHKFRQYKNILVVAHGGSITSFYGFYNALKEHTTKKAYFLSTTDPDYIHELKATLKPEDTLVVAISKSGETVTQIEMLMQFTEFPWLVITGKNSSLRAIGEKCNAEFCDHPPIGGRFTGLTEVGLLPAALCGLPVMEIYDAARVWYGEFGKDNLSFKAASVLWQLEQQGFVDVFMPFYSHALFSFSNIIVQLCHESFGKNGLGQTYFAHEAPESQHHTNQRFFGGRKNIAGFFTMLENFSHPTQNIFPPAVHSLQLKGHALFDINKIPLENSMRFEAQGTVEDARIAGIPVICQSLVSPSPAQLGQLLAFWQMYAVYASVLRGVDPFDQPQVESSKNISFDKRLAFKGLL